MTADELHTAERFVQERADLPDHGQWAEVVAGVVVLREPPDVEHGTAVLALSKAIAVWMQDRSTDAARTFDVRFATGLLIHRDPDTLLFPSAAIFARPMMFLDDDETVTDQLPTVVIEIASDRSRRESLGDRMQRFLQWGTFAAMIVDPLDKSVSIVRADRAAERFDDSESIASLPELPGFRLTVPDLFREPDWWRAPQRTETCEPSRDRG